MKNIWLNNQINNINSLIIKSFNHDSVSYCQFSTLDPQNVLGLQERATGYRQLKS